MEVEALLRYCCCKLELVMPQMHLNIRGGGQCTCFWHHTPSGLSSDHKHFLQIFFHITQNKLEEASQASWSRWPAVFRVSVMVIAYDDYGMVVVARVFLEEDSFFRC